MEEKAKRARSRKIANEVRYDRERNRLGTCRLPFRLSEMRAIRRLLENERDTTYFVPLTVPCISNVQR